MNEDDIWGRTRESRRAIADRLLSGLRLDVDHTDPPEVAERKARERADRLRRHDELFARNFVQIDGRLISRELAKSFGYEIREPTFTAGGDPEDGAIADDYRPE